MGPNKHLTHFDDYAITDICKFKSIINDMNTDISNVTTSLKWDGSPAIVFGINPENSKFFLGTKSVFNKTPKINYSIKDIYDNHGHAVGLVEKLVQAFTYLECNQDNINGIYQADILFTDKSLNFMREKDTTGNIVSFTPNLISYFVSDDLVDKNNSVIKDSKLGIVIHTKYTDLASPEPCFANPKDLLLPLNSDIFQFEIESPASLFQKSIIANFNDNIKDALNKVNDDVAEEFSNSIYPQLLLQYNNHLLKSDSDCNFPESKEQIHSEFLKWLFARRIEKLHQLKTEKSKLAQNELIKKDIEFFFRSDILEHMSLIGPVYNEASKFKNFYLKSAGSNIPVEPRIWSSEKSNYLNFTHEGLVISYSKNGKTLWSTKIVNKHQFSLSNMLNSKFSKMRKTDE